MELCGDGLTNITTIKISQLHTLVILTRRKCHSNMTKTQIKLHYHTTSYHLQLDLFSRVLQQEKEDLWAQGGLFPPSQGRSDVFTMKVYYITEDISPFFHHLWLSKLGHTALLLTCNLTVHVNNPTEFVLTDYWKWTTPSNKTKSWDTFYKWTLNKTLYTVRLSTSNCLGFCIKY